MLVSILNYSATTLRHFFQSLVKALTNGNIRKDSHKLCIYLGVFIDVLHKGSVWCSIYTTIVYLKTA